MGVKAQYSSLTSFLGSPLMNITVMALIIFGGLGFSTWNDIKVNKFRLSRYSLQSKVVLLVTLVLIVLPTIYFYFAEVSASAFADLSQKDKILSSLFLAVSPRTAGFNTVDLNALSDSGRAVTIFLMLIGGSPGSTAGGMKTTTVLVLLVSAVAVFRKNRNANCFKRSIPNDIVRNASAILILYLVLFFTGGIAISLIEGIPLSTCFFETASAVGTVGLTLGITPTLGIASRIILILLMYFGRVGGLTLIFATVSAKSGASKYPEEKITVG
jgi:trk system potassium uptake protein TrkH